MADTKISDLTEATSLADTDLFVIAQEDTANKKVTFPTLRDQVVSDPIQDIFGTPDTTFEFDTSSLTGLTAMGTPDGENADTTVPGHYYVLNDSGITAVGRYATAPSFPFTAITKMSSNIDGGTSEPFAGLFVGESTPGVMESIGLLYSGGSGKTFASRIRWTNPTTIAAYTTGGSFFDPVTMWLAIIGNTSTDIDLLYSFNGYVWKPTNLALNPSATLGSVGIFLNSGGSAHAAVFDYLRIWNSAKTFPGVP